MSLSPNEKVLADLHEVARSLLSLSKGIESGTGRFRPDALASLDLLGSLAAIAQQSLPQPPQEAVVPAPKPSLPRRAVSAPQPTRDYGSNKPEYQGALNDRNLIDALLDFHRKSRETQGELKPIAEFAPPELERVEAAPKQSTFSRARRTPGVSIPILRSPRS